MKRTVICSAILVSACAQTPIQPQQPQIAMVEPAPRPTYALPARPQRVIPQAPVWFVNVPEDTADAMFAVGTATSRDEQMAYDKARMTAERKLIESMGARISTETKMFRQDTGSALVENFQQFTRKNARGELAGAQRVDSQVTHDGQQYKVYVLLRLPLGEANTMQTQRDQQRQQRQSGIRSRAAEQHMDQNQRNEDQRQRQEDEQLRRDLAPSAPAVPAPQTRAPAAAPATVPTTSGEFRLLDVDNAEYRRRREEALQKPGAVVGHITIN